MLIIQLIRCLRGYICFHASEGFPERFLNLCNQAGAVIWDVAWQGGGMSGKTDRRGFALMQNCAAPAGITLRVLRKTGLPFFLHEYRRRAGMLLGLLVCVICLSALSGRIWTIEVQGNGRMETARILQVMGEQGVRLGARRKHLHAPDINAAALRRLPGLSWVSLNLRGSAAVIEVREELPQAVPKPSAPQNVIAGKTGQLKVLELYSGKPHARVGDTVLEGGLIAGGAVENADATLRYVHAEAYAVARTSISAAVSVPRREALARVSIPKTHYTLCFLNLRIPLGPRPAKNAVVWQTRFSYAPNVNGHPKVMPLAVERTSVIARQPQTRVKNDNQLRLAAAARLFGEVYATLRTAQFLRQEALAALGPEECVASLTGSAYENIGLPRALES